MKRLLIALILFFTVPAFASNTVTLSNNKNTITITGLDADYQSSTDSTTIPALHGGYLIIYAIQFIPSATDDRMILNDGGANDDVIFDTGVVADEYDTRIIYYDTPIKADIYFDTDDATLGTAASAKIIIYIKPPRP